MRRNIDHVEIQEPPLQEIQKKRSCLRRSCLTGCAGIIFFLIIATLFLRFFVISQPKELKILPTDFPSAIPLYDKDAIKRITFISGKQKSRTTELVAVLAEMTLSPILSLLDPEKQFSPRLDDKGNIIPVKRASWKKLARVLTSSQADRRDVIHIEWTELDAEPKFLEEYFGSGFKKEGFIVTIPSYATSARQFGFSNSLSAGTVYIEDNNTKTGTDYLSLTVSLPVTNLQSKK